MGCGPKSFGESLGTLPSQLHSLRRAAQAIESSGGLLAAPGSADQLALDAVALAQEGLELTVGSPPGQRRGRAPLVGAHPARLHLAELELRDPRLDRRDLTAQLLGALGRGRLQREGTKPLLDLGLEIAGPLDLGRDARELQLGAMPPALELAEPCGLLDEQAPLVRLGAEDLLDPALADDRAHRAAETHVGEQLDDVGAAHGRAVEQVLALAAAVQPARDRDLAVRQLGERAVLVVEDELDLAEVAGRSARGPGEQHVVGLLGPELARAHAPRGPEDGVGDVRLPGAVRPDDDGDARLEAHLDRVGKRLEAAQLDRSQVHAGPKFDAGLGRRSAAPEVRHAERRSSSARP